MHPINVAISGFAIVLPWAPHYIGGVNVVACKLYDLLNDDATTKPYFLVGSWEHRSPELLQDAGGRRVIKLRVRSPVDGNYPIFIRMAIYAAKLPLDLLRVRRVIATTGVKTINCHYVGESAIAWAILKRLRVFNGALILSFHGTDLHRVTATKGLQRSIYAWAFRQADRLVTSSEFMADKLRQSFPIVANKVTVITNGVDPEQTLRDAAAATKQYRRGNEKLIVSLGTFDPTKGHDTLIAAFTKLRLEIPNSRLIIAGRTGPALLETQNMIRANGLEEVCDLMIDGLHNDAMRLIEVADVVTIPSRREAFSLVALEAGVFGKAVVASRVGGIPEIIRDGREGLLVTPESSDELCAALITVLQDAPLATNLGRALSKRVIECYSAGKVGEKYLQVIHSINGTT